MGKSVSYLCVTALINYLNKFSNEFMLQCPMLATQQLIGYMAKFMNVGCWILSHLNFPSIIYTIFLNLKGWKSHWSTAWRRCTKCQRDGSENHDIYEVKVLKNLIFSWLKGILVYFLHHFGRHSIFFSLEKLLYYLFSDNFSEKITD